MPSVLEFSSFNWNIVKKRCVPRKANLNGLCYFQFCFVLIFFICFFHNKSCMPSTVAQCYVYDVCCIISKRGAISFMMFPVWDNLIFCSPIKIIQNLANTVKKMDG